MTVKDEVEAAYRRYITDYPAALWAHFRDGRAIDYDALDFWQFPMLFVVGTVGGTGIAIVDSDAFDRQVRAMYAGYVAEGWGGGIVLDRCDVSPIAADMALIETEGTRFRADGGVLNRWAACYWMRRTPGGWKHIAVTDTEPPRPDARQWAQWLAQAWSS